MDQESRGRIRKKLTEELKALSESLGPKQIAGHPAFIAELQASWSTGAGS